MYKHPQPTGTYKHLILKQKLNDLAKLVEWLNCAVRTYLHGALSLCFCHVTYVFRMNLQSDIV